MASLTHSDLLTRCANALRIPTSNTTETAKVTALMNEVYRDIGARYPAWWWRRKRQTVTYRITSGTGNLGDGAATNLSQGTMGFFLVTEGFP